MDARRRDLLTIAACVAAAALAVVGVVMLGALDLPAGLGLVPLTAFVAVLFLVRRLMAIAHRRRTHVQARRQAPNN